MVNIQTFPEGEACSREPVQKSPMGSQLKIAHTI